MFEIIEIKKNGFSDQSIGSIVSKNFKTAEVFRKYNIDYCCGGKVSLESVCNKNSIDIDLITKELDGVNSSFDYNQPYDEWTLSKLVDHIVNSHHQYVRNSIPILFELTAKVAGVHGARHPILQEVKIFFEQLANELTSHMYKEEEILFPFVKQLDEAFNKEDSLEQPFFKSVQNPIHMMEEEHEVAGELLAKIRQLTNAYTPPADACTSYNVLFAKLEEFEKDLHTHIHLENNILFPKAAKMEPTVLTA
jgi:regulator of cell morphogenesis and NO signaling